MGYLYLAGAIAAYTLLGASYKLSSQLKCSERQVNFYLFASAAGIALVWAWLSKALVPMKPALLLGSAMGVLTFVNVLVFRKAVARGRISTSWTILQLSLVLPVIASVIFWKEAPQARHCVGFALTLIAVVLLGLDMAKSEAE